jgi:hypothetical protein
MIRTMRPLLALAMLFSVTCGLGCGSLESNAAKDPMKCERDPKCAKHSKDYDCSQQCSDDPACVDRCREVNVTSGNIDRR